MSARHDTDETRPETLLLVPFVIGLFGLLVYFFVQLLPNVKVLLG